MEEGLLGNSRSAAVFAFLIRQPAFAFLNFDPWSELPHLVWLAALSVRYSLGGKKKEKIRSAYLLETGETAIPLCSFFWKRAQQPFPLCIHCLRFRRWCIKQPGTGQPQDPKKKNHCPLPNFGLSNELLHVVLASLCILSPSAQFCYRAIKQRRNLQLTFRSHFSESISFERLAPRFRCASCPFLLGKKNHRSLETGKAAIS